MAEVIDIDDPADPRVDDFRDLSSADRRPDLPGRKGLVIAEGVVVVQRMLDTLHKLAQELAGAAACQMAASHA